MGLWVSGGKRWRGDGLRDWKRAGSRLGVGMETSENSRRKQASK